jgi:hypothetical protein
LPGAGLAQAKTVPLSALEKAVILTPTVRPISAGCGIMLYRQFGHQAGGP